MMNQKNDNGAVVKAKKSMMRSQMRAIIILLAAVILLSAVCAVVMYIVRKDIDVYTEVLTYENDRNDVTYSYYSRKDGDGFALFDEDDAKIDSFEYEQKICYETKRGTILTIGENGMIEVIAILDNGDGETINSANTALLLYERTERSEISSIEAVNDNGGYTIYSVSEDTNGDGKKEQNFYIKDYESSPIDKTLLSAIVTRCGMLSLQVKLDRSEMLAEDEKHKNEEGYTPIINADGSINLSIYGLQDSYEVTDEKSGEKTVKTTPYFILTDKSGNVHKVIIGNMTTDENHYYVRYENIKSAILDSPTASSEQKQKEREKLDNIAKNVYLLAKDPTASSGYSSDVAKTMLASAAQISAPTIIMAYTTSNYYDVRNFTVARLEGDEYKKVISFTYDDLSKRMNTIRQDIVYRIEGEEELGLVGYEMDNDRTFAALFALTDISSAGAADSTSTAINYVKTLALVSEKVNDIEKVTEEMIENDPQVRDAVLTLYKYGFLDQSGAINAKYIMSYDTPLVLDSASSPIVSQAIYISEKTPANTYYVWSPLFNQIVEIGAQYLDFVSWDSFEWVDRDLFHTMITFCDGMRFTAGDFDALFKLYQNITVSTQVKVSATSQSYYSNEVTVDENGNKILKITLKVPYTGTMQDGTTSSQTHSTQLASYDIDTVETYFYQKQIGVSEDGMTGEVADFAKKVKAYNAANGIATATLLETMKGDKYGYIADTPFAVTFTYANGNLTVSAKVNATGGVSRVLYDNNTFDNYFAYYLGDNNREVTLNATEKAAVDQFFLSVERVKSEETRVTVSINGAPEVDIDVNNFKALYEELLKISFSGRADKTDSVGGVVLTPEQMQEYINKGDDCDMKIEFHRSVGADLIFRMNDYSATKSYTTINNSGCFYISNMVRKALLNSAKTVANGGSLES